MYSKIVPDDTPLPFKPELVPEGMLIHAGVFTHDVSEYYYSLSDASFAQFSVMSIARVGNRWSTPREAFFNSEYNEHGVHFTRDGQWVYFSSTRPTAEGGASGAWRIWRSHRTSHGWSDPEFLDIPGIEGRIASHPSMADSGRVYFHSGNADYSDLSLYVTELVDGAPGKARRVDLPGGANTNTCTPFVATDEAYLLYAKVFDGYEELFIAYREHNTWQPPQRLNGRINTSNLGNPFVTPGGQYLFFASGQTPRDAPPHDWLVKWVRTEAMLAE